MTQYQNNLDSEAEFLLHMIQCKLSMHPKNCHLKIRLYGEIYNNGENIRSESEIYGEIYGF